jgi:hypothetical protein
MVEFKPYIIGGSLAISSMVLYFSYSYFYNNSSNEQPNEQPKEQKEEQPKEQKEEQKEEQSTHPIPPSSISPIPLQSNPPQIIPPLTSITPPIPSPPIPQSITPLLSPLLSLPPLLSHTEFQTYDSVNNKIDISEENPKPVSPIPEPKGNKLIFLEDELSDIPLNENTSDNPIMIMATTTTTTTTTTHIISDIEI